MCTLIFQDAFYLKKKNILVSAFFAHSNFYGYTKGVRNQLI